MISFIVATTARPTIFNTLQSIECWPGDEILVVCDMALNLHVQQFVLQRPEIKIIHCPPGGDWGHTERNLAMPLARGTHLAHIDDDDIYADGARSAIASAIDQAPDRPIVFRMRYSNGMTLWSDQQLRCGNIGTPMVIMPNVPEKLGTWGPYYGGDFHFIETSGWAPDDYVWREETIALLRPV